jgi:hemerythrin-like metal-binding protein
MPTPPEFFVWKKEFELGLPLIDGEHRTFFEILNRCAAAARGASQAEVARLLAELDTYAQFHFGHEEEALDRVGCPDLALQRAEHRRFRLELACIRAREVPSALDALALSRDWLLHHVLEIDRRYVAWIESERPAHLGRS